MQLLLTLALEHSRKRSPSMPDAYRVIHKYTDKTANGLTKCIVDFITFSGYQAERISNQGQYRDGKKMVTDVLGRKQVIGSGTWTPGSGTKGTADISATIHGRSVKIEVKIKDAQSEAQKKYQRAIEDAGGEYWLVRSFAEFERIYNTFLNEIRANRV